LRNRTKKRLQVWTLSVLALSGCAACAWGCWKLSGLHSAGEYNWLLNPSMIPLVALSVWGAVEIARVVFDLLPSRIQPPRLLELINSWSRNTPFDRNTFEHYLQRYPGPLANILRSVVRGGLNQPAKVVNDQLEQALDRELDTLNRGISALAFISPTAQMAGLLGTVAGLWKSFGAAAELDAVARQQILQEGISGAMGTTVVGLLIAMATGAAAYLFTQNVNARERSLYTNLEPLVDLLPDVLIHQTGGAVPPTHSRNGQIHAQNS